MAKFYYGLDTSKYLGQLENSREALINLGLNPDDLDVVRGLSSANVSRSDIKNISNLDIDFTDELIKIYYGTSNYSYFIQSQKSIADDVIGNIQMNSQLGASAIKYKYINFENSTVSIADISTSRVSSWSSFDSPVTNTSPIFYGGKVTVTPDSDNVSKVDIDGIHKTTPLKARRFASEVPTHKVKMNINDSDMEFYAMRGIPVSFEAFYKNASIRLRTSATPSGYPTPNLLITNLDNSVEKIYRLGTNTQVRHFDTTSRPRLLEYYYDPKYMTELYLPSINLIEFPLTVMQNLSILDLSLNDFREMPNLKYIAPNLKQLTIVGNNMSRSVNTANYQLNNYLNNTSLEILDISGCFVDNETVDLSSFSNLRIMNHRSGYGVDNNRIMLSTGTTHIVNPNVIETYSLRGHNYTILDDSVQESSTLINLDISFNNIGGIITLDETDVLTTFISDYGNSHNIVNVSNKTNLTDYYYRYSRNLDYLPTTDKTVNGKFNGCINLRDINLYACRAYGDIDGAFANLPELKRLDIRYTNISGKITNSSFSGTDKLELLYIAGSKYDTTVDGPFISQEGISNLENLKQLYIYSNYNITGNFPNILPLKKLEIVYIENTGFTGSIPSFSTQPLIRAAIFRNNQFDGAMPTIINNSIIDIRFSNNKLASSDENQFPYLECIKLTNLILFENKFSGPITSFAGCPALRQIDLSRNQFTSYTKGALSSNRFISNINISNNNLDENSISVFILDMLENWKLNNRTKVSINFLGNNYSIANLDNNLEVKSAINFLIGQNWSIIY